MPTEVQQEFLDLLEPVYPRLARYALAITRNDDDAKDLTSETVLQAFEQFEKIREKDRFVSFLFTIASRLNRRKQYRERFRMPYVAMLAEANASDAPGPDQAAEIRIVMDALMTLPIKVRETVVFFEVADLSLEQIRTIQGGSISGVKTRLKRGRERLIDLLEVESMGVFSSKSDPQQSLQKRLAPIILRTDYAS